MHASGLSEEEKEERRKEHYRKESNYLRIKRQRLAYADFETLKIIGKGLFGTLKSDNAPQTCERCIEHAVQDFLE